MDKQRRVADRPAGRTWTRPDDYFESLARRRTARNSRREKARTEPETPRFALSTLPFIALLAALAVLSVAIMLAAWPGSSPEQKPRQYAQHEQGVAPKGWLQEAEKQFH
jgi:hypothetical protein